MGDIGALQCHYDVLSERDLVRADSWPNPMPKPVPMLEPGPEPPEPQPEALSARVRVLGRCG